MRLAILDSLLGRDVPEDGLTLRAISVLLEDRDPGVREAAQKAQEKLDQRQR